MSTDASTWHGITDDTTAQWALTKLAAYTAERDRIRRNAQAEVERIQAKAVEDEKPVTAKIEHWTSELVGYRHRLEAERPDLAKTYKLPGGNLTRRVGRKSIVVADEPAFIGWAWDHAPAALKVTPAVSVLNPAHGFIRTDEGTIVTADGERVPGVEVVTGDDVYAVTLETGAES